MATTKKLQKELIKLNDEDLKKVLGFLTDEEEETKEVDVVETKEEVVVEETVKEVKTETPQYATLEDIVGLLKQFENPFVPKEELAKVQEQVDKANKKAKPFGVEKSVDTPNETKSAKTTQDYLREINYKK